MSTGSDSPAATFSVLAAYSEIDPINVARVCEGTRCSDWLSSPADVDLDVIAGDEETIGTEGATLHDVEEFAAVEPAFE